MLLTTWHCVELYIKYTPFEFGKCKDQVSIEESLFLNILFIFKAVLISIYFLNPAFVKWLFNFPFSHSFTLPQFTHKSCEDSLSLKGEIKTKIKRLHCPSILSKEVGSLCRKSYLATSPQLSFRDSPFPSHHHFESSGVFR